MTDQQNPSHLDELPDYDKATASATDAGDPDAAAAPDAPARPDAAAPADATADRLLRLTAEFDNYRKRVARERRDLIDTAAADLLAELLPLVDDLERALSAETGAEGAAAYRQGVELIHRQLVDVLRKRGVTPIDAVGTPFDPHLHQAVTHEPSPGHADGEVLAELRRGYRLNDRLLRPSMVKVAKA